MISPLKQLSYTPPRSGEGLLAILTKEVLDVVLAEEVIIVELAEEVFALPAEGVLVLPSEGVLVSVLDGEVLNGGSSSSLKRFALQSPRLPDLKKSSAAMNYLWAVPGSLPTAEILKKFLGACAAPQLDNLVNCHFVGGGTASG